MKLDYESLGQRIRQIRKKRGITQEKLSELVDTSTTHMSHIETAHTKVSLPLVVEIANALGVSMDELLGDSLTQARPILDNEIAELVAGCSDFELRVAADSMRAIITSLRRRSALLKEE